ncbi:MAG: hypothetical protein E4H23_11285 [Chrysiogenales bacterium]|nr:MAG: hypothetical protein E4H23_11285 [Chrysiogenales bacterium]
MSRPLRIEYENAFYHVIARGERLDAIFTCPAEKEVKTGKACRQLAERLATEVMKRRKRKNQRFF